MNENTSSNISDRLDSLQGVVEDECNSIEEQASALDRQGRSARLWDMILRSMTAILAVATPALVTYSTAPDVEAFYKLLAILFAGFAGASTTLMAIFGFRQTYARNSMTALNLRRLVRDLRSKTQIAFGQQDQVVAIGQIQSALDRARELASEYQFSVARAQIEEYSAE